MSSQFKIKAQTKNLEEIFNQKKYTLDYFQRGYNWKEEHMKRLLSDLVGAFLLKYNEYSLKKEELENKSHTQYSCYYLGAFILSENNGSYSIIDGQQRLTSLTLLFIYLINNLDNEVSKKTLASMLYTESKYECGEKDFNISLKEGGPERGECFDALIEKGEYTLYNKENSDICNLVARYNDIKNFFSEECSEIIKNNLARFNKFLKQEVVMVEIVTSSEEGAYTVFESMNDRGLNLTSSEMLKGYWLSKIHKDVRKDINQQWKEKIFSLRSKSSGTYEQKFFQDWFRAKYAESIRQTNKNAENKDFEIISTRFHSWFKDNLDKIGLKEHSSQAFEDFFHKDFKFFIRNYQKILQSQNEYNHSLPHVFYIHKLGVAPSLSFPLMLASLKVEDSESIVFQKIDLVAKFLESYYIRRKINRKTVSHSSRKGFIYNLILEIRSQDLNFLQKHLFTKTQLLEYNFEDIKSYTLNRNKKFIKFLLCRMAAFVQKESKKGSANFSSYYQPKQGETFEIEHVLHSGYDKFQSMFPQKNDFELYRNNIGALVLLPKSVNQSFNNKMYEEKIDSYGDKSDNLLTASLAEKTYYQNPSFKKFIENSELPFRSYKNFTQVEIQERSRLYQKICEKLFSSRPFSV